MAKESGLGDHLYVDGYDISGDVASLGRIASPAALLDVTAIDKSGMERIYGLADGALEMAHWFNDAENQAHDVLSPKPSTNRVACYFHGGAIGNMAAGLVAKQTSYDWTRAQDGGLSGQSALNAGGGFGLEFCEQLTAGQRTDTEATTGASYQAPEGDATANGLAAYLQVFSFAGTDVTVKIQESDDDGGSDAYADVTGGGFTQITAGPTAQRIVTSLTQSVEEYLRVVTTTSAGFTSLVFAVCATRFPVQ